MYNIKVSIFFNKKLKYCKGGGSIKQVQLFLCPMADSKLMCKTIGCKKESWKGFLYCCKSCATWSGQGGKVCPSCKKRHKNEYTCCSIACYNKRKTCPRCGKLYWSGYSCCSRACYAKHTGAGEELQFGDEEKKDCILFYNAEGLGNIVGGNFQPLGFIATVVLVDGTRWEGWVKTREQAYQMHKCQNLKQLSEYLAKVKRHHQFKSNPGHAAWEISRNMLKFPFRKHEDSLPIMRKVLEQFYEQNPDAVTCLVNTGDKQLIENSDRDSWWGDGKDGRGKNWLGELHMDLRFDYRHGSR